MNASAESRGRWALLIGIDQYPNFGSEWQLEGCGNDVAILQKTLSGRFGFTGDQITVLRDGQATRDGILAAMEALVQRTGEGDEVVFFYSGHGSQQPDGKEKDEADGKDETLVPYDSGRPPFKNRDITDDEIYLWLLRLTAKMPYVTLIFDCCHSGTILRDAFAGKQRHVPEDTRPSSELAAQIPPHAFELLRDGENSPIALQRLGQKYVAVMSCGSVETSNEIRVGEQKKIAHGALTYYLVEALMDPGFTGATWREVFERVVPQVAALFRSQHPEVEGARDREIFGVREMPPMNYLVVEGCEGDTSVLGGGKVCGVCEGSEWEVYAPATRSTDDEAKFLGLVEVFEVGVTSSKARTFEQTRGGEKLTSSKVRAAIHPGCRAVELTRPMTGMRLGVEIVAPAGHPEARRLEAGLGASLFLKKADSEETADARVYLLEPRESCGRGDPAPMLGAIPEETWVPVGKDGGLLVPIFPLGYPEALKSVIRNLENVARQRGLIGTRNAGSPLEAQIDFFVHRLEGGRCVPPVLTVGNDPVFREGDRLVLEVRNRSRIPFYVYVLDIGLTGKVSPVYPVNGSQEVLEGGRSVLIGLRMDEDLQLVIPEGFQYLHRGTAEMPGDGLETLVLFATPSKADFGSLHQPPMRDSKRTGWSLNDALSITFHGGKGYMRTKEDWAAVHRTFRLRSRKAN